VDRIAFLRFPVLKLNSGGSHFDLSPSYRDEGSGEAGRPILLLRRGHSDWIPNAEFDGLRDAIGNWPVVARSDCVRRAASSCDKDVVSLVNLVVEQIERAASALRSGKVEMAALVIENDKLANDRDIAISNARGHTAFQQQLARSGLLLYRDRHRRESR